MPAQASGPTGLRSDIATGVIPTSTSPQLHFRLVPYLQDATVQPSTAPARAIETHLANKGTDGFPMSEYEKYSTAVLSNTAKLNAYSLQVILPTIVTVGTFNNHNLTFSGPTNFHTKNVVLSETQSAHDNIVAANTATSQTY